MSRKLSNYLKLPKYIFLYSSLDLLCILPSSESVMQCISVNSYYSVYSVTDCSKTCIGHIFVKNINLNFKSGVTQIKSSI